MTPTNVTVGPAGIRNKNPGNLRFNKIGWVGEIGDEKGFSVFDNMLNGIRASYINLRTSYNKYGRETLREIINAWAPHHENPTVAYINYVSHKTGIQPDEPFRLNEQNAVKILYAMFIFENGGEFISEGEIKAGIALA